MNIHEQLAQQLRLDYGDDGVRLDDAALTNASIFLERELTQVRTKIYEVKYPELRTMSFLPIATDIDPDADVYSMTIADSYGRARIVGKDDLQIPMVSTGVREETGKVVEVALGYGWTASEIRRAQRLNKPLESRLASATRRGIASAIDEILRTGQLASTGQVAHQLAGFLNNSSITASQVMSAWLATGGARPTTDAVFADLNNLLWAPRIRTNGLFIPNTMLIATQLYKEISTRPMFTAGGDTTVLEYFQRANPGVNIAAWDALNATGTGGVAGYHQIVVYPYSAEVVEGIVPIEFEQGMPEVKNFRTSVPCRGRCGGTVWHVPSAAEYGFVAPAVG